MNDPYASQGNKILPGDDQYVSLTVSLPKVESGDYKLQAVLINQGVNELDYDMYTPNNTAEIPIMVEKDQDEPEPPLGDPPGIPPQTPQPPSGSPEGGGTVPVPGGIDPNEKVGPSGSGPQHAVSPTEALAYIIYFENLPEATGPAQEVFITDALDPNLDWSTFQVTDIAFGNYLVPVGEQAGQFHTQATISDYRQELEQFWLVDISMQLNPLTGQISWALRTLDPVTGFLPEDPLAGFLPPNDASGRGEGHISFTVFPKAGLPGGVKITNQAWIIFDVNPPVETNLVENTISLPVYQIFLPVENQVSERKGILRKVINVLTMELR